MRTIVERSIRLLAIGGVAAALYSQQAVLTLACGDDASDRTCYSGLRHSSFPFVPKPAEGGFEGASRARFQDFHPWMNGAAVERLWPSPFPSFQQTNWNCCGWDFGGRRRERGFVPAEDDNAAGSQGQSESSGPQKPPASPGSPSSPSAHGIESPQHLFYVVPAYNVAYSKKFKPMTPRQKFHVWLEGTYDPRGLGLVAAEAAALEHSARHGFCGYGRGGGGYLRCYGSMELDLSFSGFFGAAVFPVLMHQDPRYFRLGKGSTPKRVGYAISRIFVTHADSGRIVFDASALSGSVLAAAASNLYLPRSDQGFGHSVNRLAVDLGDTTAFNIAAEYWPDIQHLLQRMGHIF